MDFAIMARSISVFVFFAMLLAMNLEDNIVARLGMEGNYGLMLGMALLFTMLVIERNIYLVAAIVGLCLLANMPADFTLNFGLDRDIYAGLMLALLVQPFFARIME